MANPTEAQTRTELIDPALVKAGWDISNPDQVGTEIPTAEISPAAWQAWDAELHRLREAGAPYQAKPPQGVSDYVLYRPNGEIIAVVEAKRSSMDARIAQAQTEFYVTEIGKRQSFQPFAFMTNGRDIYFWDVGRANKRLVCGFFSPADLDNLLYLREHQKSLTTAPINTTITDRSYQIEAIRRVCETFAQGKRQALLIMATGTGKTRVAMGLVDLFLCTNQARHILFVADRDALVRQALVEGFQEFIPHEPHTRIYTHHIDTTNRLYVVTLQTLSNCFARFTPAFFDLIIFDEVHRSIFNKWNEVLQYFDGRMIGLTATPANFIDRNTFLAFECADEVPTFLYSYEDAVKEGYLVDYSVYIARTRFQRRGIHGIDLNEEERNALREQGLEPDELDFSGTDLERTVSNRDTLRDQWQEFWDECLKDESGQLPGKTIVFAMTQAHALRLAEVFEEMFPQYPGLVQVITCNSEYQGQLIQNFKQQDLPRIAISVDMLETGVNVPEVVNLVFMRPVHSQIKLQQMIGRGTRTDAACTHPAWLPNGHKEEFLIIDFWENDFSGEPREEGAQSLPVLVALFNTRLKLLELYLHDQPSAEAQSVIAALRAQIGLIPTASFSVRRVYAEVEAAWADAFWQYITPDKLQFLKLKVGPLLRYAPGVDVPAATFTHKVERLKLGILTGADTSATARSIAEDASLLSPFAYEHERVSAARDFCFTPQLQTATVAQLNEVIDTLAAQMKNRKKVSSFVELDLPDFVELRGYIMLVQRGEQVYVEKYRQLVEQRILDLAARDSIIAALACGESVTDLQLVELERTLRQELGGELELSEQNIRKAYARKVGSLLEFVRDMLELDGVPDYREIVRRQFDNYIAQHQFNADQTRFLRALQNVFLDKRRVQLADLYAPPLTSFGDDAVERWFSAKEVQEMLFFLDNISI